MAVPSELGVDQAQGTRAPAPDCFVDRDGVSGRIGITCPDGLADGRSATIAHGVRPLAYLHPMVETG